MKTKETQVSKRKTEMDHSKNEAMSTTGKTLLEYNTFLYDLGCELAEKSTTNHQELIRMPEYWKWFRNEFYLYEKNLFRVIKIARKHLDHPNFKKQEFNNYVYTREMMYLLDDEYVEKSIHNFIKHI